MVLLTISADKCKLCRWLNCRRCCCRTASQLTTLPCARAAPLTVPAREVFTQSATVWRAITSNISANIPLIIISITQPFQTSGRVIQKCRDILLMLSSGVCLTVSPLLADCALLCHLIVCSSWSTCSTFCFCWVQNEKLVVAADGCNLYVVMWKWRTSVSWRCYWYV